MDAATYWEDRRAGRLYRFWAGDPVRLVDGRTGTVGTNWDMYHGEPQGCAVQLDEGSTLDVSALDLTCAECGTTGGHRPTCAECGGTMSSTSSDVPAPRATPLDVARGWLHRHWLGALVATAGLLMATGLLGALTSR